MITISLEGWDDLQERLLTATEAKLSEVDAEIGAAAAEMELAAKGYGWFTKWYYAL